MIFNTYILNKLVQLDLLKAKLPQSFMFLLPLQQFGMED